SYDGFSGMVPGAGLFGGGLMLLGLIFPLGILVLIVLGIIALFRVVKRPTAPVVTSGSSTVCSKCGSPVQSSWTHCATCGEKL
ncbi:MAG: zinc ribbon domain-containing protein, partial [Leptolinea sp.]